MYQSFSHSLFSIRLCLVFYSILRKNPERGEFNAAYSSSPHCIAPLSDISLILYDRLSRWFSTAISAWFSMQLLQSPRTVHPKPEANLDSTSKSSEASKQSKPAAGRTLDLTLFAATRALDVIVGEVWARRRKHLPPSHNRTTRALDRLTSELTDPLIFATTSGIVMWNWFYSPDALPRAYNKWIASAAAVDERLIVALQRCRTRELRYGEDSGQASLLQDMCRDYKWPLEWGDPAISIPFPCELVHMGCGPSCELHALTRFARAWWWSLKMYLPLQFAMFLLRFKGSKTLRRDLLRTVTSASKSSAFLGTFITLFYYGVCLARTRLGPHILGTSTTARQKIDSGICVGAGCFLCGWSVLLESASRRKELALFVAPRAVATMLPRRYDADKLWMERMVFAMSTAVVFTCVLENKQRVRGILGPVLGMLLTPA